jgi:hypothetical protein
VGDSFGSDFNDNLNVWFREELQREGGKYNYRRGAPAREPLAGKTVQAWKSLCTAPIPHMRVGQTASGACTSGSTEPPLHPLSPPPAELERGSFATHGEETLVYGHPAMGLVGQK